MGRGRQKAKQTKVARELKYFTPDTDFKSLERELSGKAGHDDDASSNDDRDDNDDDYANWSAGDGR